MTPNTLSSDAALAAAELAPLLIARGWRLATAESCTGGLIAAACTALPGSSAWFELGWVTYSNAAKTTQLGVPTDCIDTHGAVSLAVAEAMARGAWQHAGAECAVSVTGIAGPTGGSAEKPVGTVCFGWVTPGRDGPLAWTESRWFAGDRTAVRQQAACHALSALVMALGRTPAVDVTA
jgi:nicotinamide-nucleotide amidase